MNKNLPAKFAGTLLLLLLSVAGFAQTTISTITTAPTATASTSPGAVTFAVRNNNAYPIAVTQVGAFHHSANAGKTYTVWYNSTAVTGAPSITAANGWVQLGVSPIISATTSGVQTLLTNKYLVIPAATTFRFAVVISAGANYYGTSTTNTWPGGGVDILTGNSTVSAGYAGVTPSPATTPATFSGAITFITASVNNVMATSVVQPLNNAQFCFDAPTLVRAVIRNVGANPQSNIPVTALYTTTTSSATISGTYTGTLQPFQSDTVVIGTLLPPAGFTYTMRAYTELASDTVKINDTTATSVTFTYKPTVPNPVTISDTVCLNGNAFMSILSQPGTIYKWYSAASGGTLVNVGNTFPINPLTADSSLYISGTVSGCESGRTPIHAIVGPAPVITLPADTSFCESIPMVLDAENPGGKYLWSTGDTTQTITVTNVSGQYWVMVDKYCVAFDTSNVTIAPLPSVTGVSFIKLGNTFHFNASAVQNVTDYLWIFGDGGTSTDAAPQYTYVNNTLTQYEVILVVSNGCGTDTARRMVNVTVGVDDMDLETAVVTYPNPATSQLTIKSAAAMVTDVQVVDMMGKIVANYTYNKVQNCVVDVQSLATGNYILNIRTTEGDVHKPLQIMR